MVFLQWTIMELEETPKKRDGVPVMSSLIQQDAERQQGLVEFTT